MGYFDHSTVTPRLVALVLQPTAVNEMRLGPCWHWGQLGHKSQWRQNSHARLHPSCPLSESLARATPDPWPGFVHQYKHGPNCASTVLKWARDQAKGLDLCSPTLLNSWSTFWATLGLSKTRRDGLGESPLQGLSPTGSRGISAPGGASNSPSFRPPNSSLCPLAPSQGTPTHLVSHRANEAAESCNAGMALFQAIQAEKEKSHRIIFTSLGLKSIAWDPQPRTI